MPDGTPVPRRRAEIMNCPVCGEEIGVTLLETPRVETCPHCQNVYTVPSVDGSTELPPRDPFEIVDDEAESEEEAARRLEEERENRLNAMHMAAVASDRRSKNRLRLFCVGGATVCAVGIIQAGILVVKRPDVLHDRQRAIALAAVVVGLLYFIIWLLRKSARLGAELRRALLADPQQSPDFRPLQDGSQRWRNLENM